jgi:hypothetical protein
MELLNPFEVDDRHDADKKIPMLRDIKRLGDDCSMQPLVEKHVSVWRYLLPRREGPWLLIVGCGLFFIVKIIANLPFSAFSIDAE